MPRLSDLLEYMSHPSLSDKWILLDIKLDNDADTVMRLIASTLASVPPSPSRPWSDRVLLGIWAAKFLPLCQKYLPGYPISHIGFSTCYARQFLKVPNVSFNMLQKVLLGPIGARFIHDVKKAHRPLFVWTVNDANLMKWSIQMEVDGVITDDPKKFNKICDEWEGDKEKIARPSVAQWLYTFWLWAIILVFSISFKRRFPETVEAFLRRNQVREKATLKLGA
jgi:glycerophosphoryl diester phosphodiesterase